MKCMVCGATDQERPIMAYPVRIDGDPGEHIALVCSDHVFAPAGVR